MNYRFQKFTTVYDDFLRKFLAEAPFFFYELLPFQDLYDKFIGTWYSLSNFFARHMETLGHPAQDLFASIEPLQKAWARENKVAYPPETWLNSIVIAQVQSFQPDVLFLQDMSLFDPAFRAQLREASPKPLFMIGWRGAPSGDFSSFGDLDLIVAPYPHFVENLKSHGATAALLCLGFEASVLDVVNCRQRRDLDFIFAGSLGSQKGIHAQRFALIENLLASTPLQVWGTGPSLEPMLPRSRRSNFVLNAIYQSNLALDQLKVPERFKARIPLVQRGMYWGENPAWPTLRERYPGRIRPPVFGLEYYRLLARAKITLNVHPDLAANYAGNMRLFEATGMGTCLMTEWKENLADLFEPELEVVTYRSAKECIEKVRYLLDHEEERQAIAAAGQRRTLRDHTLATRVRQLDELINPMLKK